MYIQKKVTKFCVACVDFSHYLVLIALKPSTWGWNNPFSVCVCLCACLSVCVCMNMHLPDDNY